MSGAGFTPEFRLVAACCRPSGLTDFCDAITSAARSSFDPDLLLATARAHRVEGFVANGLQLAGVALPPARAALLGTRAAASRQQMLRNAAEEIRVSRRLHAAGIEPLSVKGATIAMLAHGTLALKTSWDIDLLVPPRAIGAARDVLTNAGYRLALPGIDDPRLIDRFIERCKETVWLNAERRTAIELHRILVDVAAQLPGVGPGAPTQRVELARGAAVTTLATPELYAYLCVHGTSHRWERLKWLTDVAALIARVPGGAQILHEAASRLGAARSSATALQLCDEVLGMPAPTFPARAGGGVHRLVRTSRAALQSVDTIDDDSFDGLMKELTRLRAQWLQIERPGGRLDLLRNKLSLAYTPGRLALPRWILPLHAIFWLPIRLITRPARKRQLSGGKTASKP